MTGADLQPYKMSFAVGGLLLNESVEVARMHAPSEAWDATLRRALEGGVTSLPKAASRRRTLREIVNRISTLSDEELGYLVQVADRQDQQALATDRGRYRRRSSGHAGGQQYARYS